MIGGINISVFHSLKYTANKIKLLNFSLKVWSFQDWNNIQIGAKCDLTNLKRLFLKIIQCNPDSVPNWLFLVRRIRTKNVPLNSDVTRSRFTCHYTRSWYCDYQIKRDIAVGSTRPKIRFLLNCHLAILARKETNLPPFFNFFTTTNDLFGNHPTWTRGKINNWHPL